MLALLAMMGIENIHSMNGLKTLLATCGNAVAVIVFIVARAVFWPQALVMIFGGALGGYVGAWYAQKMEPQKRALRCDHDRLQHDGVFLLARVPDAVNFRRPSLTIPPLSR